MRLNEEYDVHTANQYENPTMNFVSKYLLEVLTAMIAFGFVAAIYLILENSKVLTVVATNQTHLVEDVAEIKADVKEIDNAVNNVESGERTLREKIEDIEDDVTILLDSQRTAYPSN